MKESVRSASAVLIALIALLIAIIALLNARTARELALSELTIEEGAAMTLPVYDEEANRFSYVAIYEVHIGNVSGPAVKLQRVAPAADDAGFIVALKGEEVEAVDLSPQTFYVNHTLPALQSDARLLKELPNDRLDENRLLNWVIKPGESKTVRFGVNLFPYDAQGRTQIDMALLSFRFVFDNGKAPIFRRGFPILPVIPTP